MDLTNPYPGTYTYNFGSQQTFTAGSNSYWTFDHWMLDGSYYSSSSSVTLTLSKSQYNLVAYYDAVSPILTMQAYDDYRGVHDALYPQVWIDGHYEGTDWFSTPISAGSHTISITGIIYDKWWKMYFGYEYSWAGSNRYSGTYNPNNNTVTFEITVTSIVRL